jgi:hypothetical protein
MAFGQRSSQSTTQFGPNTKVFFVSIKEKDLPQPFFEIKTKEGDKTVVVAGVDKQIKFLAGDLVDIRNKTGKTAEGKEIESASVSIFDREKDEGYIVSVGQTFLGRNILNSLVNLKTFNGIEIGLYTSKPKPGQAKGFKSAAVRQNGQLIYGKFKNEELPEIKKVQVGKEVHSDQVMINAFFTQQVEEFAKVLRAARPAGSTQAGNNTGATPSAEPDGANPPADTDSFMPGDDEPTLPGGKTLRF